MVSASAREIGYPDLNYSLFSPFSWGATSEISNVYNLSARLTIFNTHIPPIITTQTSKFRSCLSDTF